MSTPTPQIVEESGLPPEAAADLEPVLSALRGLEPTESPEPSAELAALLASPRSRVGSRRAAAAIGAAAALGSLTLTGVAAAANELPEPAQRFVSQFSERYLPFEFPRPVQDAPQDPEPGVVPGKQAPTAPDQGTGTGFPEVTATPSWSPQPSGSPSPSGRPSSEVTPSDEPSAGAGQSPTAPEGTPEPEVQPEETPRTAPASPDVAVPESPVAGDGGSQPPAPRETPAREAGDGGAVDVTPNVDPALDPTAGELAPGVG